MAKILYVDGSKEAAATFKGLEEAGHEVIHCKSDVEADFALIAGVFDLVICGHILEGKITGLTYVDLLRGGGGLWRRRPLIFLARLPKIAHRFDFDKQKVDFFKVSSGLPLGADLLNAVTRALARLGT